MKIAIVVIISVAIGFGMGWLAAKRPLYFSSMEYSESMMRFNAESEVAVATMNIRSASKGDTSAIVRINCQRAKSAVRLVDPIFYTDPQKQREVARLRNNALELVETLSSAGNCGRG